LVEGNQARGGNGLGDGGGGDAFGGGLYIAGGAASLTGVTLSNNWVFGGLGASPCLAGCGGGPAGPGGNGLGGGLYVAAGASAALCSDAVDFNAAYGAYPGGQSEGGGISIAPKATVYLDAFTVANTINNTAIVDPNIDGSYILQPC
jgi:hypothetical protein